MEPKPHLEFGLWRTLREAVLGSHQDFTEGPLGRAVLLLAVPMVLEMLMESLFGVVDIFVVSRIGSNAVAAVGLTESLLSIIYAVALGLSAGATALVARRTGEKDPDGAARVAVQAFLLAVGCSLPVMVVGLWHSESLLRLLGGTPEVVAVGTRYAQLQLSANVVVILLFLLNAVLRGAGDAAAAVRVLWLSNGINIVLSPLLAWGVGPFPHLGVFGAGLATVIGRSVGVGYQLLRLFRPNERIVVRRRHLEVDLPVLWSMVKLSGAAVFQSIINSASWIFLIRILAGFGSAVVAGYTIGIRIVVFAILPAYGLANAAATLVGQALGAHKPERAERAAWMTARYNAVLLGSVGLLFVVVARPLTGLFAQDPVVHDMARTCLQVISAGFVLFGPGLVFVQSLNGAGDTVTPTLLNILCFWLVELPLSYFLSFSMHLGPRGGFLAVAIAFALQALLGALWFRTGRWKSIQV